MRSPREYRAWLLEQRRQLAQQEAEAHRELMAAEAADGPYKAAFHLAHDDLARTYADYLKINGCDRDELFAAYDRRVFASHLWHPHKTRLAEATRWHRAIMDDLRYVNSQLEPKHKNKR